MTMNNRYFASITTALLVAATGCASNLDDERIDGSEDAGQIQAASVEAEAPDAQTELTRRANGATTTANAAAQAGNTLGGNLANGETSAKTAAQTGYKVRIQGNEQEPQEPTPGFTSFDEVSTRQLQVLAEDLVFSSPIFLNSFSSLQDVTDFDLGGAVTPVADIRHCMQIVRGSNGFTIDIQCSDDAGVTTDALAGQFQCAADIPDGLQLRLRCSAGLTHDRSSLEGNVDLELDMQSKRKVSSRFVDADGYSTDGSHMFRRYRNCNVQSGRILHSSDGGQLRLSYDEVLRCQDRCEPEAGNFHMSKYSADPASGEAPQRASLKQVEGVWQVVTQRGTSVAQNLCR